MADSKLTALDQCSIPSVDDELYGVDIDDTTDHADGSSRAYILKRLMGAFPLEPGGRLTTSSGVPVGTTTGTTIYYTPKEHNRIDLFDGTRWVSVITTEKSLGLTATAANMYDVFGFLSSGALALETLVWTNTTTRATGISLQDGRYCKTGAKDRLYLGSLYATTTNTTGYTANTIALWNMYNRVDYEMAFYEATDSWTYGTATWRKLNNSDNNAFNLVRGLDEDSVYASLGIHCIGGNGNVGIAVGAGTPTNVFAGLAQAATSAEVNSFYSAKPGIGYRVLNAMEYAGSGTATFYGDVGLTYIRGGMVGRMRA